MVEVLPNKRDFIKKPYVAEAEAAMRLAYSQKSNTFRGHKDAVNTATFSHDGKYILSASRDNTIKLWEFPTLQEIIEKTRERFKNNPLTKEERIKFYLE